MESTLKSLAQRRRTMAYKQERLKEIINIILEKNDRQPLNTLQFDLSLRNDLGMDSLDLAELTVRIEDEFGVDIFEDGMIDTIQEILDKINKR